MTQNDLTRAIAKFAGETVTEISHRGFQPLRESAQKDPEAYILDWEPAEGRAKRLTHEAATPRFADCLRSDI